MPVKPAENGKTVEKLSVRLKTMSASLVSLVVGRAKERVGIIVCNKLVRKNCYVDKIVIACAVEMMPGVLQPRVQN
jgi:hypothetical protein